MKRNCKTKGGASKYISALQSAEKKEHRAINALARLATRNSGGRVVRRAIKNRKGTHMSGIDTSVCAELFERWVDEAGLTEQMSKAVNVPPTRKGLRAIGKALAQINHGDNQRRIAKRAKAMKTGGVYWTKAGNAYKYSKDGRVVTPYGAGKDSARLTKRGHIYEGIFDDTPASRRDRYQYIARSEMRAAKARKKSKKGRKQMSKAVHAPPTRKGLLAIGKELAEAGRSGNMRRIAERKKAMRTGGVYRTKSGGAYKYSDNSYGFRLRPGSFVRQVVGKKYGPKRPTAQLLLEDGDPGGIGYHFISKSERAAAKKRSRRKQMSKIDIDKVRRYARSKKIMQDIAINTGGNYRTAAGRTYRYSPGETGGPGGTAHPGNFVYLTGPSSVTRKMVRRVPSMTATGYYRRTIEGTRHYKEPEVRRSRTEKILAAARAQGAFKKPKKGRKR